MVSSTVVPAATRASIVSHSAEPAARVEPGGGLVEEEHRRAHHQRGGEVEAAAHAARVGLGQTIRRVGELEALEQLRRRASRRRTSAMW